MADKIATREAYGNALASLELTTTLSFSMPTLRRLQKQVYSRRNTPKDFSTVVLPRAI